MRAGEKKKIDGATGQNVGLGNVGCQAVLMAK